MNAILKTVLQRLALGFVTLFVVSALISASVELLPGDFAKEILGQAATPDTVKAFEKQVGLDRSPVTRYFSWIGGVLQGDFGTSYVAREGYTRTVVSLIVPRLMNTLFLAAMTAISSPEFFIAYILVLFLVANAHLFPALSTVDQDTSFTERVYRCVLPATTLLLVIVAHMMRMTRAAIINLLASPYIEMSRLKGISPRRIILHHALPNAWAPIANVIAVNLAYLVVGVVVVEVVFVYPGIGQLMVDSVSARDIPVVQACALIFAVTYIGLNLLADIVSIVTNPRLLHPR